MLKISNHLAYIYAFQTSTGVVEVQLASGHQNNNLQTAAVVALGKPAELRDEDIIESVSMAATTVARLGPAVKHVPCALRMRRWQQQAASPPRYQLRRQLPAPRPTAL